MNSIHNTPTRVELRQGSKQLHIDWQDGSSTKVAFQLLREHCACSSCRANKLKGVTSVSQDVDVTNANSMGSSGIQFEFSDGHNRGIFPWAYIKAIGEGRAEQFLETRQAIAC